ncbi:hypothetical protein BO71DRAFT_441948 [Aspergillus ellipticus CBS 707.79]|uniref:Pyruvate decarboxylase n=1 Tax=Aspergillus ellipticus CBS 707.79 TaxID=1448320 RepID=A0A319DY21_9EURO|nr:hypothetical protein BO71DRAFT_441948 [Aspergillus ellipticus CBS 707.79]
MAQTQTMLSSHLMEHHLPSREHKSNVAPSPGPDEVLVNLKFSGLCHSDLHTWKDGHEGVGIVIAVGKDVKDIKNGDHVGVQWINGTCGVCDADKRSEYLSCPHARITGYSVDGTFGDYCISQARHVVRIPKQYPLDTVAPIICAGTTCFRAVQESGAQAGDTVAIVGHGGGLGSLACQYARARGCRILAISTGDDGRRLYKEKIGVDFYVDYQRSSNVIAEVQKITGGGPNVALLIESMEPLLKAALQYVCPRGTVVVVGLPPGATVDVDLSNLMSRMAHIKASPYGGTREQIEEAIHIFVNERFYQPSHIVDLAQLPGVLKSIQRYNPKEMTPEEPLRYGVQLLGEAIVKIPHTETTSIVQAPVSQPDPQPTFYQNNYNVGTYLAYRLEELGIREYFVVPGDSNLVLLDNLLKNPNLQMIGCCNELNTGYAADGYARNSAAKVAVVVVPYIVGGLSILNAISGACSQKLKIIVLSGCPSTNLLASDKFLHHAPTLSNRYQGLHAYQGVTAASVRLDSAETAAGVLDDTIGKCLEESIPVYIEVPNDLASAACTPPLPLRQKLKTKSLPESVDEAVESITDIWNSSRKPILLLGSLARRSLSRDHIELLADKLGCAVLCQPDGRCMTECHPQYCGQFWSGMTNPEGESVVMGSDLWLVIGGNWSDLHATAMDINQERHRMISVDKNWVELPDGKCIESVDIRTLVSQLIQSDMDSKSESVPRPKPLLGAQAPEGPEIPEAPVTIKSAMCGIQKILKEYDTLICDAGESWFIANHILLPPGADCQMQFPYCSIGWGLPAGLGSQLARTQGRAVILIGDGGFQMTAQELSTMIRRRTNPIIMVFNNLGYKIETAVHEGPYNYIANWDYTKLATAFSTAPHAPSHNPYSRKEDEALEGNPAMFAMKIRTQEDLKQALQRADEEHDKLAFLELCIQPDDLTDELQRLGSMVAKSYTEQPTESYDLPTETTREVIKPKAQPMNGSVSGYTNGADKVPAKDLRDHHSKHPKNRQKTQPNGINKAKYQKDLNASRLKVTLSTEPKPVPAPDDPEVLSHQACTDHMIQVQWTLERGWESPKLVPYRSLSLTPTASALHYATECFEGMKVYRGYDGKLRLFRPALNCARMLSSAERIGLPRFNPEELHRLIHRICAVEGPKWLSSDRAGECMYIRPALVGTGKGLGLAAPSEAHMYILLSYWPTPPSNPSPFRLWGSTEDMVRAWPGGTGNVKVGANYGASILGHQKAVSLGYDQVLWLFGPNRQVTEAGATNFFVIWETEKGQLQMVTAPLDDQITLPGITRRSILELARERLSGDAPLQVNMVDKTSKIVRPLEVVEEAFTIHDIIDAADQGRLRGAFSSGTAYFIVPVSCIAYEGREVNLDVNDVPYAAVLRRWMSDIVYGKKNCAWAEVVEE